MMSDNRSDLIAGCGDLGSALGRLLIGEGRPLLALRRSASPLPEGVTPIEADLSRPETLRAIPDNEKLGTVYYTAAAEETTEEAYRATYVAGVSNLLDQVALCGVKRLIYVSSTAVYAQKGGEWVDEQSPTRPERFQGRLILEGEEVVRQSGIPFIIVRFGGIYGPGREWLINLVRQGKARIRGGAPHYSNRIHRDDAAAVLHHVARLPDPDELYVGVDREPADLGEVFRWLAGRLGLPEPDVEDAPVERGSKRCSSARLVESGYHFRYPDFRKGYESILEGRTG